LPGVGVLDDDQVPALRVGACRSPAACFGDLQQGLAIDFLALFEAPDAAALDDDLEQILVASHRRLASIFTINSSAQKTSEREHHEFVQQRGRYGICGLFFCRR
jgi:hypothetical protein